MEEETLPLLHRRNPSKKNYATKKSKSGISLLFRYSKWVDHILMTVGSVFAVIHGASLPVLSVIFGQMTNTLISQTVSSNIRNYSLLISNESSTTEATTLDFAESMTNYSIYYSYISFGVLVSAFIQTYCWELSCERQVYNLRVVFFTQILHQDISWFDCNKGGDLTVKLSDDLERVKEGIGSKCSMVIQYIATFLAGMIVGFLVSWKLTLAVLIVGPLLIGTSAYLARMTSSSAAREQEKYALAGQVADQVLSNMRTVVAFGKQGHEIWRFDEALQSGLIIAMKKYMILSSCFGAMSLLNYVGYGVTFWYGSLLTAEGEATAGTVFTVFFSVMSGAFSLGNAMPYITVVSTAVGAASTLFAIIDRVPVIDSYSEDGLKPEKVKGDIELRNVSFSYPARETVQVLNRINLNIKAGQKVGIVGASGSGKSTIVSLLLHFYDPTEGQILLDGTDIRTLNLSWLRRNIGVVSQEPTLFGLSIYENITLGHPHEVRPTDVIKASSDANAHSFISKLPEGYDTKVGTIKGAAQISGGEKQRIAIARALIRNPPILILDEATSALDSSNEESLQHTLDEAAQGRTTIIIAHRLSTVYKADCIYVLKDGVVVEHGNHSQLLSQKGHYFNLVEAQRNASKDHRNEDKFISSLTYSKKTKEVKPKMKGPSVGGALGELALTIDEALSTGASNKSNPVMRLLKMNAPEWKSLSIGFLGCVCTAAIMPVFAIFYGEVFNTFTLPGPLLMERANFWAEMFVALAFWAGIASFVQTIAMSRAAEFLVKRVRVMTFTNILRQPVSWFDHDDTSPSKLCSKLARDAPLVKSAAGLRAGLALGAVVTLVSALSIAFVFGWKLALVLMLGVPALIFANYQLTLISRRYENRDAHLMDLAGKVVSECIQNIWTVQSLGKEQKFLELYLDYLVEPLLEAKKQAQIFACTFAFCQAVIYAMYAAAFRFGGYLVEIDDMDVVSVFRVFFAMAMSAQSIGQTTAYMQDYTRARFAAEQLLQLIDRAPEMKTGDTKPRISGHIIFRAVHFSYPSRPNIAILSGLNLEVKPGQTLALVGASGSGKSTIIALLERFYEPDSGAIMVDGNDIRTIEPSYLRSHIGLVTQEPVLFDCSLRENIAYGSQDILDMEDIINAAKAANIHDFIKGLPQGYDTPASSCTGQSQLSGGQKQRIAIARALVRNPTILLLDEATSALDARSEQEVQAALDIARQGRTCIIIAHRLSTIQNADSIAVVHKGKIVEQGPHHYLMSLREKYYELVRHQGL